MLGRGGIAAVVLLAAVVGLMAASATPAAADSIDPCADPPPGAQAPDWCLDESIGGDDDSSDLGGGSSGGGSAGEAPCGWVTIPTEILPPNRVGRPIMFTNGFPPDDMEVVWQGWCYTDDEYSSFRGPFRWVPVGAPAPLTPAEVAQGAYEAIQGRMPDPAVMTSPPVGVDATVGVPVFVTVTNWESELTEVRDLLGDTVTVRATPTLVLRSGEPEDASRSCAGPGREYDPEGGDLWDQAAAPGACTFVYERRTGVQGRPDSWPSTVVVEWSISWSSTSGESGVFPVVERTVAVPRAVDEVPTVVVGTED